MRYAKQERESKPESELRLNVHVGEGAPTSELNISLPFERELPIAKGYPPRYVVPAPKRAWSVQYPEYSPPEYESPRVLEQDRTRVPGGWADPPEVTRDEFLSWSRSGYMRSFEGPIVHDPVTGCPRNPLGRVGISGRGALGKWGPNHAADALLTRCSEETGLFEVLLIQRQSGEWAIPGGMVDAGESPLETARRELGEETSVVLDDTRPRLVYQGMGDGPRLTDHAWIETTVYHFHLQDGSSAAAQGVAAGSDAAGASWFVITPELVRSLYANHGVLLQMAMSQFLEIENELPEGLHIQLESLGHAPLLTSFSELKGRVGVFGGSFDPVHSDHLILARRLKELHTLDVVVFVPAGQNPLKDAPTSASPRARVAMLENALWGERGMYVSPIQTRREGRSYTVDLIDTIREQLPPEQATLFWIMGADCVMQLPRWRECARIVDEVEIIACSREGYPNPRNDPQAFGALCEELGAERATKALQHFTQLPVNRISSTQIREALQDGEVPESVPNSVRRMIHRYELYRRT